MNPEEFLSAVSSGDRATVRTALEQDPTLAAVRTTGGATALQWAVYHGKKELVEDLWSPDRPVDFATACTIGKLDAIPPDADVDELSTDGFRPIALAAAFGNNDVLRLLLQKGADPNKRSIALGGVGPIHAAVFGRNLEALKLLIEAGADVNAAQENGFTALMGAAQNGDVEMVKYLVERGADTAVRTEEDKSAADFAATEEIRIGLINGFG